jgi:hypothetical protein
MCPQVTRRVGRREVPFLWRRLTVCNQRIRLKGASHATGLCFMSLFERLPVTAALAHCLLTKTIWTKQLPRQPHPLLLQRATTKKVAPLDPPYPHSSLFCLFRRARL